MPCALLLFLSTLLLLPQAVTGQQVVRYDFEELEPGAAAFSGWQLFGPPRGTALTASFGFRGERSAHIDATSIRTNEFVSFAAFMPPDLFLGQGVILRGAIRTADLERSSGLMLRVDGVEGVTSFDNMSETGPTGTTEWTEFELRAEVPENTQQIVIGVMQRGPGQSWFDEISVSIDSSVVAADSEALAEPPPEELPEPDSTLPDENPEWVAAAARTGFPLASIDSESFEDLDFLPEVIGDRRVVQLGESGHGVDEFSRAKIRLIKYLHQEMGFDVLAFESALHGCYEANRRADTFTAGELLSGCIFGVWNTEEVLELFEYVLETRDTDRPLILAGFDTQNSSRRAPEWREEFWRETLEPISPEYAEEIVALDRRTIANLTAPDSLQANRETWSEAYRALARYVQERANEITAQNPDVPETTGLAHRLAISTVHLMDQYAAPPGWGGTLARDEGMADNLDFVLDGLYPDRKVIVWGHNFHIRHANDAVAPNPVKTMGQWVAERRRDDLYTVGLYMRHGRAAMNDRQVYNVLPPRSGDLESILGHVGEPYLFIDLATTGADPAGVWVHQPIVTKTWGTSDVEMVLSEQYDAILFIDEVHPPVYR